ncbi:hypothetical protein [Streptomyces sp. NPDC003077]|uniref:hypothetical protein n=1 Tax=Streptomyces sp. NPDC003077 TaxID=3154443 RepID=UPI0033A2069F
MTAQIPHTRSSATKADPSATVPDIGGFAPQISAHSVVALTLGRQNANDADKSNYFESD